MTDLSQIFLQAESSTAHALADLQRLQETTDQALESLRAARLDGQRAAFLAQYDQDALKTFFKSPYLVRPVGTDEYELISPSFLGPIGGWYLRTDGAYRIARLSRFIQMINPAPDWLADELGFKAPPFHALLEGNSLIVDRGDPQAMATDLDSRAIVRREGNRLYFKPASRFDLIREIIRRYGFVPYTPRPVPTEWLREGRATFTLRPHQQRSFDTFLQQGAQSLFVYPQTGKSFVGLKAIDVLIGRKVIFVPRSSLIDHWRLMIEFYLGPDILKEIDIVTYQGARKVLKNKYVFALYDEAHHMPADFAIGTATDLQTETRLGLSATPKRQDGNEDLIVALCGPISGGDWPVRETQKPTVTVWIVRNDKAKIDLAAQLCEAPIEGKTVLFSWRLEIGRQAAARLGVPFIYSQTKRPLDVVRDNDTVVVSSVGNEGWSFPIRRAIELSFLYGSEMEAGQRAGRLAFEVAGQSKPGEHHVLMTADEFERYRKRLTIYYEWGLDVAIKVPGTGSVEIDNGLIRLSRSSETRPHARAARRIKQPAAGVSSARSKPRGRGVEKPKSETQRLLEIPGIAKLFAEAQSKVGANTAPFVARVFDLLYGVAFSIDEIASGKGLRNEANIARYRSACNALRGVGLVIVSGQDEEERERYTLDLEGKIAQLRRLDERLRRPGK